MRVTGRGRGFKSSIHIDNPFSPKPLILKKYIRRQASLTLLGNLPVLP
ncbi:hypothetical protein H206_06167 [Candidatus Electrothrix aarhusensis]|uniref:Uncharacterized protein n=1 Tax=Candidatus Electrothrix aarhusensis TaxID=1859131 RepID=A0A3S3R9T4_9BACT|nr:hypothetical protein H206_06167 [Candidatus Electrothrix aarhusensis]